MIGALSPSRCKYYSMAIRLLETISYFRTTCTTGESRKVYTFDELWNEKYVTDIFKTRMVIYQSKANLDEKILCGKITHL